jgi:hypothetical protein
LLISTQHNTIEKLGQIGPVTASYVCLKTPDGLTALDPARGTVLWTKSDITPQTRIFGDDDYVYLIDVRDNNTVVGAARALRGQDGAAAKVPDFSTAFLRRERILGGRLFISEKDAIEGTVLRLYEVRTGKDLWKKSLPRSSVILRSEDPKFVGMVEPNGHLSVVDLQLAKEVFHASILPAHLDKVNDGLLLADSRQWYAILNKPNEQNVNQGPWPNAVTLRTAPVNGMVYAFDRASSKLGWYVNVPQQMVLLERFAELPMVVFTAKYHKKVENPGSFTVIAATLSIDKRTGKRIYDREVPSGYPSQPHGQFFALQIDRQAGTVDLISTTMRLRHYVGSSGTKVSWKQSEFDQPLGSLRRGPGEQRVPRLPVLPAVQPAAQPVRALPRRAAKPAPQPSVAN